MDLEEAILDKVRRLPPAKQEEVLRFADGLQRSATARMVPSRDRTKEMKWIDENRAAYTDQWVAVEGDCLITAGMDPLKVFATAKAKGIQIPSLCMCFLKIHFRLFQVGKNAGLARLLCLSPLHCGYRRNRRPDHALYWETIGRTLSQAGYGRRTLHL